MSIFFDARRFTRCLRYVAIGSLLALCWGPAAHANAQPLTGEQIFELITGNALQGSFTAKVLVMYFNPNGKIVATLRNSPDSGTWWIKGDQYCHKFVRLFGGMERCYQWHPPASEDGRYILKSSSAFKGKDIRGKITQGNPGGY